MKSSLQPSTPLLLLLLGSWAWVTPVMQAQQTGARRATTYPGATQVGEAMVSSDPETRKLIVVTDDVTAAQIGQVITNLDRASPQVLIKVVFLEVTHRKGLDIGIEGEYRGANNGTTNIVTQAFGLASQGTSPAPPGAGMYQVLGSDFQATLRAIAVAGKTEVLSRPSILARNNQQAIITVGQEVPLVTGVNYDTFGNQRSTVTYRSVGIILRVTPFITSNGLVEMLVSPEISNLSDETVNIAAGVDIPVINSRSADTVVITPDGQTVVIGGLMQNNKTEVDSKIPVLGDIPGLGLLFKRKQTTENKTELLIFLTPHIVKQPSELASVTASEKAATQLMNRSFSEDDLNLFLDNVPIKEPTPARKKRK